MAYAKSYCSAPARQTASGAGVERMQGSYAGADRRDAVVLYGAHVIARRTEAAEWRGDLFVKSCCLMAAWSTYCRAKAVGGAVISIKRTL